MAKRKITITLDEDQLSQVHALVESGSVASVSAFVQHAVRICLEDDAEFDTMLSEILEATGGPMTAEEREWADEVLGIKPRKRRRTPAA